MPTGLPLAAFAGRLERSMRDSLVAWLDGIEEKRAKCGCGSVALCDSSTRWIFVGLLQSKVSKRTKPFPVRSTMFYPDLT